MKKYVIITNEDVSNVDFSQVQEESVNTLRWNKDNTKTFVKFVGVKSYDEDTPSFLVGKTQYTYEQMLSILNDTNGEWYIEDTTSD